MILLIINCMFDFLRFQSIDLIFQTKFCILETSIDKSNRKLPIHVTPALLFLLIKLHSNCNVIQCISSSYFLLKSSFMKITQIIFGKHTCKFLTKIILYIRIALVSIAITVKLHLNLLLIILQCL